jgi:hypothetical protein
MFHDPIRADREPLHDVISTQRRQKRGEAHSYHTLCFCSFRASCKHCSSLVALKTHPMENGADLIRMALDNWHSQIELLESSCSSLAMKYRVSGTTGSGDLDLALEGDRFTEIEAAQAFCLVEWDVEEREAFWSDKASRWGRAAIMFMGCDDHGDSCDSRQAIFFVFALASLDC